MKPIRIFISSTFRDMHSERDYLVKYVFPELSERCAKRGLNIVPVDLRWGVTEEEAEKGKSLEICLEEIENCRPYFIGILGERYGWVPDNYKCPNVKKFDWLKDFEPGHSITALEIYQGILKNKDMQIRAFFYFRNKEFIKDVPISKHCDILSKNEKSAKKLYHLKENIKDTYDIERLPGHYTDGYTCHYKGLRIYWPQVKADIGTALTAEDLEVFEKIAGDDNLVDNEEYEGLNEKQRKIIDKYGVVYLAGLEDFGKDVLEDLWQAIKQENPESEIITAPLIIERSQHQAFMHNKTRQFIGREDIMKNIEEHINSKQINKPLFLLGEPGTGKSAIMAKAALQWRAANPEAYSIARFVGISPNSTDIYKLVLNVAEDLSYHFGFEIDRERLEKIDTTFDYFLEILYMLSSKGRKVLIVIDALNKLHSSNEPQYLKWLPKILPENVSIILSTIHSEYITYAEKFEIPIINIGGLADIHCKEILKTKLGEYRKTLPEIKIAEILKREDAQKPLYLTVACEELRIFPDFHLINARINTLPDTIPQLFEEVLERLEKDHGRQLVQDALSIIECSMYGLLESEILELLKPIDTERLPLFTWVRLYRNLALYLLNPSDNNVGLIDFFHHQLSLAVKIRYLKDNETEKYYYKKLAEYGFGKYNLNNCNVNNTILYTGIYLYKARETEILHKLLNNIFATGNKNYCTEEKIATELYKWVTENFEYDEESILRMNIDKQIKNENQQQLCSFITKNGKKLLNSGKMKWALGLFEKQREFFKLLLSKEPDNSEFKVGVSLSSNYIGNILLEMKEGDKAFKYLNESMLIRESLTESDSTNFDLQILLTNSYISLGRLFLMRRDFNNSLAIYERALHKIDSLFEIEPNEALYNNFHIICCQIGTIHLMNERMEKALDLYLKGLSVIKYMLDQEPSRIAFQSEYAKNLGLIGKTYYKLNAKEKAAKYFKNAIQINNSIINQQPDNAGYLLSLAISYWDFSVVCSEDECQQLLSKIKNIIEPLILRGYENNQMSQLFQIVSKELKNKDVIIDKNHKSSEEEIIIQSTKINALIDEYNNSQDINTLTTIAELKYNLSVFLLKCGYLDKGCDILNEAYDISLELNNKKLIFACKELMKIFEEMANLF